MRPLVIKFGGTSLATPARMLRAARRVAAYARRGRPVAVVVSATGHSTDRILAWAGAFGPAECADGRRREVDRAAATGEALSAALFATALWTLGIRAASLGGGEAGVLAEGPFGAARIRDVRTARLRALFADGVVPVVAGFQGIRHDGETVTLGRGGSDTSAVALAAALGAECHIVTDVDGVYPRDPRLCPGETAFDCLDHASLVSLAEGGAQVVHHSAARLAEERDVPLWIYSFRAPLRAPGGTRVASGAALGGALAAS
jgi:aspartate kinase